MTNQDTIDVLDRGHPLSFSFEDMMRYHGPGSPGGVAHAFKVMERAFPMLDEDAPPERREIRIETPFGGPGARDAFELVTRAATGERYLVDPGLARTARGRTLERFVFTLEYRERRITLVIRDGFVPDEFIDLARRDSRTPDEEARLDTLKAEMARLLTSTPAAEVYDATADV